MNDVFVYWDNSNVYHEAQRLADERECTPGARDQASLDFLRRPTARANVPDATSRS